MNALRIGAVTSKVGVAKSTIYKWVKERRFPRPFSLNGDVTVWDESDIDHWLLTQKQGAKIETQ